MRMRTFVIRYNNYVLERLSRVKLLLYEDEKVVTFSLYGS